MGTILLPLLTLLDLNLLDESAASSDGVLGLVPKIDTQYLIVLRIQDLDRRNYGSEM